MTTHDDKLPSRDLEMLAFCYIMGELSDEDCEAFETRLADDQSAREAVARNVMLAESVAALSMAELPASVAVDLAADVDVAAAMNVGRAHERWLVAAACVLALGACLSLFWPRAQGTQSQELATTEVGPDQQENGETVDGDSVDSLLAVWADADLHSLLDSTLAESNLSDAASSLNDDGFVESDQTLVLVELAEADGGPEFVVPGWMLAAVGTYSPMTDDSGIEFSDPESPLPGTGSGVPQTWEN